MIANLKIFKCPLPFGGFNDTDDQMGIPPNILVDILNFEFDKNGLKTRPGYSVYNTSGLPTSNPNVGLYAFKKSDGNKYLLSVVNTDLYVEGAVGVFSSVYSSLTADYAMDFATIANLAVGGNGTDEPIKYDGTTCLTLKCAAPTVAASTATGAAGNLTGDYQYKVTFVTDSGAETNPSPSSTVVSPSADQVSISNIQTGTGEVSSRRIYRTTNGGSVFYLLDTINDNTTTTYTDDIVDADLGTDIVPSNHDDPPTGLKFLAVYKEFLFGVDPDYPGRVYFSHQSYPEIFSTAEGTGFYMIIGLNDGEEIIGIMPLRGTLFVHKERSTWPVVGDNEDDFRTTPQALTSSIGLYHRSMDYVDLGGGDVLVGLGKNGFYAFDGYSYRNLGVQPEIGIDITTFINSLDPLQLKWAYGFNDVKKNQYRCFVRQSGYAYNNKELVWDYKKNRISIFDRKGNAAVEWNNNILFSSSQSDGKLHTIGGLNDNGSAITQTLEWSWWSVGDDIVVTFSRVNVDTTLQGLDYSPSFTCYVDGRVSAHALNLPSGNDWGSSAWVADSGYYRVKVPLPIVGSDAVNLTGQSIKFKLTHSGLNQPITINGLTLFYAENSELLSGVDVDPTVLAGMGV